MVYFNNNNKLDFIFNYKFGFNKNIINNNKISNIIFSINMLTQNVNYVKSDFDNLLILIIYLERLTSQKVIITKIKKLKSKEIVSNIIIILKSSVSNLKKITFLLIIIKLLTRKYNKNKLHTSIFLYSNFIIKFNYKNIYEILPYLEIEDNNISFKLNVMFVIKNQSNCNYIRNNLLNTYNIK